MGPGARGQCGGTAAPDRLSRRLVPFLGAGGRRWYGESGDVCLVPRACLLPPVGPVAAQRPPGLPMSSRGRDGLVARIRQIRRSLPAPAATPPPASAGGDAQRIDALQARVEDREHMVQGLQDSVYREAQRQERRMTELEARLDPATLAIALSKDARERGL